MRRASPVTRGHQVESGHDAPPQCGQPPGQAAGGAGAGQGVDRDAELPPVAVGQDSEPVRQPPHLLGGSPLLRSEDGGCLAEQRGDVAGHLQVDAGQGPARADDPHRTPPPVGGGRASTAHDDPAGPGVPGAEEEMAHPGGVGHHRVLSVRVGEQGPPGGAGHLDDRRRAPRAGLGQEAPFGHRRGAERTGHRE